MNIANTSVAPAGDLGAQSTYSANSFRPPPSIFQMKEKARGARLKGCSMFRSFSLMLRDWVAFHQTYGALRRLDSHLRRDLGLADADLRRISRKVMHENGPISLLALREEDEDSQPDVRGSAAPKAQFACGPARRDAQETQRFHRPPYPA
jgi:uncharacterized protein YjiS (DUF1127 family)